VQRKEVCKIIQPRMAEIFSLVKDQLLKKDYLKHLGGGVVLTGGGSILPGAAELAQEVFGRRARVGVPFKMGGLSDVYQTPVYSTAVGLVMYEDMQLKSEGRGSVSPRRGGSGMMGKLKSWMREFF
jgi:cell division protein FtsA